MASGQSYSILQRCISGLVACVERVARAAARAAAILRRHRRRRHRRRLYTRGLQLIVITR